MSTSLLKLPDLELSEQSLKSYWVFSVMDLIPLNKFNLPTVFFFQIAETRTNAFLSSVCVISNLQRKKQPSARREIKPKIHKTQKGYKMSKIISEK